MRHPKPWQLAGTARFLCLHEIAALPDYDTIRASCWRRCWISGGGISEAIVLGCAGMLDLAADLSARHRLPVLDGVACAVKLVETLVGLGLKISKIGGYASPCPSLMAAGSPATGLTNRHCFIETAWVILNCAGGWLGYSTLSMTADVTTAPKPDQ